MPSKRATTLSAESIGQFRSWLSGQGRSDQTIKAYTSDLTQLLLDLKGTLVEESDFDTTATYWLTKNRKTLAPKTTSRRLTSLRTFAKWARWETPDLSEYRLPQGAAPVAHPLPEGIEGVRRLIAATPDERRKTLIALCGLAGLRISEALDVRFDDINHLEMTLKVRGKGEKQRIVPISTELWEYLQVPYVRAFGSDEPIVGLKDRVARKSITDLGRRAGLKRPISSHDLRATFLTAVYNSTLDMRVAQDLAGHASVVTTQTYTEVTLKRMREAVQL